MVSSYQAPSWEKRFHETLQAGSSIRSAEMSYCHHDNLLVLMKLARHLRQDVAIFDNLSHHYVVDPPAKLVVSKRHQEYMQLVAAADTISVSSISICQGPTVFSMMLLPEQLGCIFQCNTMFSHRYHHNFPVPTQCPGRVFHSQPRLRNCSALSSRSCWDE